MRTFKHTGLADFERKINNLKVSTGDMEDILRAGGLPIVEELKRQVESLPDRPNVHGSNVSKTRGVLAIHKKELLKDIGTSKMQYKDGFYDVKIGFYKGYLYPTTKKYPQGTPTQLLVRALEKGTSWLSPTPVVKPALNKSKDKVVPAMQQEFEKKIKE